VKFDIRDWHIYGGGIAAAVGVAAIDWRVGLALGGAYLAYLGLRIRKA